MRITKAQEILDIISPIPAEEFCVGEFENIHGQSCFIGHINRHFEASADDDYNGFGARQLTKRYFTEKHDLMNCSGVTVNNSPDVNGYNEPEIKDRIIHLLNDMIAAGY